MFAMIVGGVMIVGLVLVGVMQQSQSAMPLVGSCSAAIAAQCHPGEDEDPDTIALGSVMWGDIETPPAWAASWKKEERDPTCGSSESWLIDDASSEDGNGNNEKDPPPHCGFSSTQVIEPDLRKAYA